MRMEEMMGMIMGRVGVQAKAMLSVDGNWKMNGR